VEIKSASLKFL